MPDEPQLRHGALSASNRMKPLPANVSQARRCWVIPSLEISSSFSAGDQPPSPSDCAAGKMPSSRSVRTF
jgi:hypothetical protein